MTHKNGAHEKAIKALEEHGFLFQQRCLAEIRNGAQSYLFESEEYPVSISEEETSIDFVFRTRAGAQTYLIFECKRVNPDYLSWLFFRPKSQSTATFLSTKIDFSGRAINEFWLQTATLDLFSGKENPYVSGGLELSEREGKSARPGRTSRTTAIQEACQQVLTGVGGLALEHYEWRGRQESTGPWYYLPIVLTTANLLLTEFDESEIGLRTGQLPISKANTKSVDWVVLTFPVRGSLQVTKPTHSAYYPCGPSDDFRLRFKVKSVAIVRGEKVLDFLRSIVLP
jgi:hypothetical protein